MLSWRRGRRLGTLARWALAPAPAAPPAPAGASPARRRFSVGRHSGGTQWEGKVGAAWEPPAEGGDAPAPRAFPQDRIRNFSIIAHIDHGKSTLADRLMEATGAIEPGLRAQYLDRLQVEGERGITVKAKTASIRFRHGGHDYLLNLIGERRGAAAGGRGRRRTGRRGGPAASPPAGPSAHAAPRRRPTRPPPHLRARADTPGHVDFSYEVSRSLAACKGALLLVDASQGVQAQTVANYMLAWEQGLSIVPVLNKIDMPTADVGGVLAELEDSFALDPSDALLVSAKEGTGLDGVLRAVVERVPPPDGDPGAPLRALLFDAIHDEYRGIICLFQVVDGEITRGMRIASAATGEAYEAAEVGVLTPHMTPTGRLGTGQVGYVVTGMKGVAGARVGDTWHAAGAPVEPLPEFKPAQPKVFAGVYPASADDFESLLAAMDRLLLTDSSVTLAREHSAALGMGFRCGFLGLLHMDVFRQRLEDEFGATAIVTTPTVPYRVVLAGGGEVVLENPTQFPTDKKIAAVYEPVVRATVVTPNDHLGTVLQMVHGRRGEVDNQSPLGAARTVLVCRLPSSELASNFYDRLKGATSGYATFDYEDAGTRPADLVRLDVAVNGEPVDAMARVVHRSDAEREGRRLVARLKEIMSREMFDVALQAKVGGRIVARETVKAFRKDVTAKCYGGDASRKRKLLERQKEGKKRMRMFGNVQVPASAFVDLARA